MNHISFLSLVVITLLHTPSPPSILSSTFGIILILINIWSSRSTFEVLGEFAWFYGDFFIYAMETENKLKKNLYYHGIYRFINDPDLTTGFAGYYGMALLSGSWLIFAMALLSQAFYFGFVKFVEKYHTILFVSFF